MNWKAYLVFVSFAVIVAGCVTEKEPPVQTGATKGGEEAQEVVSVLERESIQDENFVLYFDEDPEKCTFHPKRKGTTLADLANFAMQTCWAKRLSRKFGEGPSVPLTDNDVKLANFCLDTHFMFLDTLSVAMLNDLTQSDKIVQDYTSVKSPNKDLNSDFESDEDSSSKLDRQIEATYNELKENFLTSTDSALRNCIRNWGRKFEAENAQEANWLSVYSGIYNQMPSVDIEKVKAEHKSWLWMPRIVAEYEEQVLDAAEQPASGIPTVETAEAWAVMASMTRRYVDSLNSIYGQIEKFHSDLGNTDTRSLEKVQSIMDKKGLNVRSYNRFFGGALYDMPLTFYALRGYAGAYENWHWHGDNEEGMYDAAKFMVMGIRGIEMISNAKSLYSVNAYNSTVSFLKNKLSEAEFQTLLTDTKMYHVDLAEDVTSKNTIQRYENKNKLAPPEGR